MQHNCSASAFCFLQSFFREKGPLSLCEKRLQLMEELCQKLPEEDSAHRSLQSAKKEFGEVQTEVQSTRLKLLQHQDKWKDYNKRSREGGSHIDCQSEQTFYLLEVQCVLIGC